MNILMVAAENGALAGGKVGGMGDVIRDIPLALTRQGHHVDVIMPGYMHFSKLPGAHLRAEVVVPFRGHQERVKVFELPAAEDGSLVRCWLLEHTEFAAAGAGKIYCDDPPDRPFASDASKFALFSVAVAQAVVDGVLDDYQVIHLHDWHSALLAVLARYHPYYEAISAKTLVYTIHNLSLQGIRPLHGDSSSLHSWFPELVCDTTQLRDPRYGDCINPMRAAIRLCDKVHAVSPAYAHEIQRPSDRERGFVGGEGLESDLRQACSEGRLVGILNGCEYPDVAESDAGEEGADSSLVEGSLLSEGSLQVLKQQVLQWIAAQQSVPSVHYIAADRINDWRQASLPDDVVLVTSVGRLTDQKVRLLREPLGDGRSGLEHILDRLEGRGLLLLLGSGDPVYESFIAKVAAARSNLLFLKGYSEDLAELMYAHGDLFLMPSSFEPCGISQMLAMRAGQPCLVHGVGGLRDTVSDNLTGFVFSGDSPLQQAENMVERFSEAIALRSEDPDQWQGVSQAAGACRFYWSDVAEQYVSQLYGG
ncbi:glycogen synthase [Pseudomaricurvus alcaniphilus]|uniref:glycogen synthase n=1 Tax=Pseudomaricurvus alcaniphilus TaxID=1166482 RepID=UPI00140A37F4|nr:glycogen/starch synthase [Pseudomaricurvus alcaniphilus]NHN37383.1 glycogen synthase [Pseudomaricurvus alcaniphilus]